MPRRNRRLRTQARLDWSQLYAELDRRRDWTRREGAGLRRERDTPADPSGQTMERHPDTAAGTVSMCRACRRARRTA
jgi:hypothetical protein